MRNVLKCRPEWIFLCLGLVVTAACPAQEQPLTARDVSSLLPLITPLVQKQDPFPHGARVKLQATGGGGRQITFEGQTRAVIPVLISFDRYANSYCRVAVIDQQKKTADLVPVPGNYEHCGGMEKMADVDLNHDGIPDLVFQVNIPSNRFDTTVSEGAVYVSQAASRTYCYAPAASSEVTSDIPPQADKILEVIQDAVKRKGAQILNCYSPPVVPQRGSLVEPAKPGQ